MSELTGDGSTGTDEAAGDESGAGTKETEEQNPADGEKDAETKPAEPSPDNKSTDDESGSDESEKSEDKEKPIEYEEFKLEGDFTLADADIEVFKGLKLSQEQAQSLIDHETQRVKDQTKAYQDQVDAQRDQWVKDAKSDKEFGGHDYDKNVGIARDAIGKFASKDFVKLLDDTGLTDHPEMIRFAYNIGKLVQEDGSGSGSSETEDTRTLAQKLYPNQGN